MASYQAKIDVIVGGIRELAALEGRLEQIQNIASALKRDPIDLNIGGRGKTRDLSGKLSKEINDIVRSFTNGERKLGSSISSINQQASLFRDVLSQTALKGNGVTATFERQNPIVRQLVTVYSNATEASKNFELQQRNVIRTSQGLQTEINREIQLIQRRTKVARLRELKRRREEALSSGIVGGAFPLLFGGGLGASLFGGLGGAAGGFVGGQFGLGLSLVGTSIGSVFDTVAAKTADLGKALNMLNPDVEVITESLGIAGTETERYIQALIETGKETEAATFAVQKLEELIGFNGVQALSQFGEESQELTNEMAKFFTQMQAGIAQLINSTGVFRSATQGVARSVTLSAAQAARGRSPALDKALDALDKERRDPKSGLAGLGISALIPQAATEAETAVLREFKKVQVEAGEIIDANGVKRKEEAKAIKEALKAAQYKLTLENGNNDVLNESVQNAIRTANIEKTRLEIKEAGNDESKLELAFTNAAIRSKQLENRISKAIDARDRKAASKKDAANREAKRAAQEILRLDTNIGREKLKQAKFEQDISIVGKSRLEQVKSELAFLPIRKSLERALIISSTDDLNLQIEKLRTLELQYDLKQKQLEQSEREIELQEAAIDAVRAASAAAGFDVLGVASRDRGAFAPSGGLLTPSTGPVSFTKGAELAPIIEQEVALARVLEKYQEIGQAAQLTSELVTTGFIDMVSGTRSAEEVFANFLNSLADMLIKTAQQMIAQYIAIGIARMFAMGGSPASYVKGVDLNKDFFTGSPIPFMANGGPVSGGSPYIVGERGPELFVPRASGTIVPNDKMGGGVTVGSINISVENSGDSLSPAAQKQIAGQVQGIVLSTLANERRSGGML